jgi:hypothetical protein
MCVYSSRITPLKTDELDRVTSSFKDIVDMYVDIHLRALGYI